MRPQKDYSKAPEVKADPSWGRPRYAWAILFTFTVTVAYLSIYHRIPYAVRESIDGTYHVFWVPILGSLIMQSSVRGVWPKLATIVLGSVGLTVMGWCLGMLSMMGGD